MKDFIITGARVILPDIIMEGNDVVVSEGKITRIGAGFTDGGKKIIDARGAYLCPGLVDNHIHGAAGVMVETATTKDLNTMSTMLAGFGTTAFLPTIASSPKDLTLSALSTITRATNEVTGAHILGVHMEGPYLNPVRVGAQRPDAVRNYVPGELSDYRKAASGAIKIMGCAPEIAGGLGLIDDLVGSGIVAGAVHTDATYDQALEAIGRGLRLSCHTFNAMRPIHHREPGIAVAVLLAKGVYCEFIADGFHLALPMIEAAYRLKGSDRMILVSDGVAAGVPEGDYDFFAFRTRVQGGKVFFPETGGLAGSASSLLAGVKNLHASTDVPLAHAVRAASLNPATIIGWGDRVGSIAPGKFADLLLLDEELNILKVWVGGKEMV